MRPRPHYYAIRPLTKPPSNHHIRVECAETPEAACTLAFGRGRLRVWQWLDMGTRKTIMYSYTRRMKLIQNPRNWITVTEDDVKKRYST